MIRILKESETKREAIFAREDPVGSVEEPVREIIAQVRAKGDEALKRYTKEFDGVDITSVEVGQGAIDEGFRMADPMLVDILYRASERVAAFHQHQVRNSFLVNEEDGILMGQKIIPLERVGFYVPGGTAAYPSSVIMNCIPAKLAGVKEVIERTQPEVLAIEKLFYQHNQTTVIGVAEARGVILLAAAQAGLPIYEYTPMQVKQAVTGYGKAVKKQVQEMTRVLLHLPAVPKPDDTADALAMAITFCHTNGNQLNRFMRRGVGPI